MKRSKRSKRKAPHRDAPWTPFYECTTLIDGEGNEVRPDPDTHYLRNNHYQVDLKVFAPREPFGRIAWISVKRTDRAPIHDWRDLQRIKNEVISPAIEAVELYPAEARHVDTSNQYHLWAFIDGYRLPFGYSERLLMDPDVRGEVPSGRLSRQRPFRGHMRPADVLSPREALEGEDK